MNKEQQKNIIKTQLHRVITVKSNLLKRRKKGNDTHPLIDALNFIINYDTPHICNSTEERIFSAMQEGRYC